MRMCSCILLAGIFSPVMGDTRYSSGAGAGGRGLEAKRKQKCLRKNNGWQPGLRGCCFIHISFIQDTSIQCHTASSTMHVARTPEMTKPCSPLQGLRQRVNNVFTRHLETSHPRNRTHEGRKARPTFGVIVFPDNDLVWSWGQRRWHGCLWGWGHFLPFFFII